MSLLLHVRVRTGDSPPDGLVRFWPRSHVELPRQLSEKSFFPPVCVAFCFSRVFSLRTYPLRHSTPDSLLVLSSDKSPLVPGWRRLGKGQKSKRREGARRLEVLEDGSPRKIQQPLGSSALRSAPRFFSAQVEPRRGGIRSSAYPPGVQQQQKRRRR